MIRGAGFDPSGRQLALSFVRPRWTWCCCQTSRQGLFGIRALEARHQDEKKNPCQAERSKTLPAWARSHKASLEQGLVQWPSVFRGSGRGISVSSPRPRARPDL